MYLSILILSLILIVNFDTLYNIRSLQLKYAHLFNNVINYLIDKSGSGYE